MAEPFLHFFKKKGWKIVFAYYRHLWSLSNVVFDPRQTESTKNWHNEMLHCSVCQNQDQPISFQPFQDSRLIGWFDFFPDPASGGQWWDEACEGWEGGCCWPWINILFTRREKVDWTTYQQRKPDYDPKDVSRRSDNVSSREWPAYTADGKRLRSASETRRNYFLIFHSSVLVKRKKKT